MSKSTSAPTGTHPIRRKAGPLATVLAVKTASLVVFVFAVYIIAMFLAVRVVPLVMGFVKAGTGVTESTPWDTTLMVWIGPSVVLIALITVGTVYLVRWLWKLRTRVVDRVAGWAFGREPRESTASVREPSRSKAVRAAKTKTA